MATSRAEADAVFDALAPAGGFVHAGPVGAGHFTTLVHNGIEYGLMHAYGEGYQLLSASELSIDVPSVVKAWGHGSVIRAGCSSCSPSPSTTTRSWRGSGATRPTRAGAAGRSKKQCGSGVPLTVLAAALFARFSSRDDDSPAMRVVAALRHEFGGHAVERA